MANDKQILFTILMSLVDDSVRNGIDIKNSAVLIQQYIRSSAPDG